MSRAIRVVQLSDTHFLEEGAEPEGGHGYDTAEAFDAVLGHLGDQSGVDLVVVTGDVADHGRAEQYRRAADSFARFDVPVNVCPGNHDLDAAFGAGMGRPGVSTSRVILAGSWAFVFVDSSAGLMEPDESGVHIDPPGEERLHSNGRLGPREAAWLTGVCDQTTAEHVFVWLHHPPAPGLPLSHDDDYEAEWARLLRGLPGVRGLGGGHTHVPNEYEFAGRQVFVAPSLKNNFDLETREWLPPGYRSYDFGADGSVTSQVHLIDDERWPRHPFGRALHALFMGELSHAELAEIVARRTARGN